MPRDAGRAARDLLLVDGIAHLGVAQYAAAGRLGRFVRDDGEIASLPGSPFRHRGFAGVAWQLTPPDFRCGVGPLPSSPLRGEDRMRLARSPHWAWAGRAAEFRPDQNRAATVAAMIWSLKRAVGSFDWSCWNLYSSRRSRLYAKRFGNT